MYKIELSRTSEKELENIYRFDRKLYLRIINSLESLQKNPYQGKKLKDRLKRNFSLRVGTYRIIYTVIKDRLIVYIIDIGHRKEIYR